MDLRDPPLQTEPFQLIDVPQTDVKPDILEGLVSYQLGERVIRVFFEHVGPESVVGSSQIYCIIPIVHPPNMLAVLSTAQYATEPRTKGE